MLTILLKCGYFLIWGGVDKLISAGMDRPLNLAGTTIIKIDDHGIVDAGSSHPPLKHSYYFLFFGIDLEELADDSKHHFVIVWLILEQIYVIFENTEFVYGNLH